MAVERAFGMLKERWCILLKKIDMPLRNLPDIVTASLCLHNLCILENDEFSMDWAKEAEKELQIEANLSLGRMHKKTCFLPWNHLCEKWGSCKKEIFKPKIHHP